jgi:hypothetical protein
MTMAVHRGVTPGTPPLTTTEQQPCEVADPEDGHPYNPDHHRGTITKLMSQFNYMTCNDFPGSLPLSVWLEAALAFCVC